MSIQNKSRAIVLISLVVLFIFLAVDLLFFNKIISIVIKIPFVSLYSQKLLKAYQILKIPFLYSVISLIVCIWLFSTPVDKALKSRYWVYRSTILLLLVLLLPIVAHAYVGTFTRFMADDYCSSGIAQSKGILSAAQYWYVTWSGRYSADFLDSLMGILGTRLVPYSTFLVLSLWIAASFYTIYQLLLSLNQPTRVLFSSVLTAAILFSILTLSPSIDQSLYWGQGMRSLIPPFMLSSICIGILVFSSRQSRSSTSIYLWGLLAGIVAFIAGGFNETFMAFQVTAFIIALGIMLVFGSISVKKKLLRQIVICSLFSIASCALVFLAPGNHVRQMTIGSPSGLVTTLVFAAGSTVQFLIMEFNSWNSVLTLLGLFFLAGMIGFYLELQFSRKQVALTLFGLPVVSFLSLLACFAPAAYVMREFPPERTQIVPVFIFTLTVGLGGFFLGQLIRKMVVIPPSIKNQLLFRLPAVIILILYGFIAPLNAYKVFRRVPSLSIYAQNWDANDAKIRAATSAGLDQVSISFIQNPAGLVDIDPDPNYWLNACINRYYGITVDGYQIKR